MRRFQARAGDGNTACREISQPLPIVGWALGVGVAAVALA